MKSKNLFEATELYQRHFTYLYKYNLHVQSITLNITLNSQISYGQHVPLHLWYIMHSGMYIPDALYPLHCPKTLHNLLSIFQAKAIGPTLSVLLLLLLFSFASMDDHASVKALQETWRLLALLHLDLGHRQQEGCFANFPTV